MAQNQAPPGQPIYPPYEQYGPNYNNGNIVPPSNQPIQYNPNQYQQPMFPGAANAVNYTAPATLDEILEILIRSGKFVVAERVRYAEVISNLEFNNQYDVMDENGFKLMIIKEKSTIFQRNCCGNHREYTFLYKTSNESKVLMEMDRNCHIDCCGFIPNNISHLKIVENNRSDHVCSIEQGKCWHSAKFMVKDHVQSMPEMTIDGGCIVCQFQLLSTKFKFMIEGQEIKVKKVLKSFRDAMKEAFSDATRFEIIIPDEIKRKPYIKDLILILLGTVIQIDMAYFEQEVGSNQGFVGNMIN